MTSKLQPLDLEVIQNFKIHYRDLLRYVLCKRDECDKHSDIAKSNNILIAFKLVARLSH